ncbi:MAG: S8/S53 family peptidase [Sphingomonas sp.]|uniref:S8 family peptidase n=1 Tax=Sphingomonas sp. TaxID=28214 RepID=UPI002276A95D|nr:S8/S53 family peptidase [Sphingomonas sp.]MCX8477066.1 S8/S53 family peptidase [Sphingomonas sp.]
MNSLLLSLVALIETAAPVPAPALVVAPVAISIERPRVAIIDSGVAKTTELAPLVSAEYDMASDPGRPQFQPRYDHGTMVATILARAAHRQVDIISLRIDDPAGCPEGANPPCQPSAAPVVRAIRRATELGVDAINISLALDKDPAITAAIADAAAKGIRVVLAAGNNGYDHPGNLAPARAAYPNAVLVGAIDSAGQPWSGTNRPDATPEGYNYAWQLGVKVPTAAIDGRAVTGTGTSFAAPLETARLLASRTMAGK